VPHDGRTSYGHGHRTSRSARRGQSGVRDGLPPTERRGAAPDWGRALRLERDLDTRGLCFGDRSGIVIACCLAGQCYRGSRRWRECSCCAAGSGTGGGTPGVGLDVDSLSSPLVHSKSYGSRLGYSSDDPARWQHRHGFGGAVCDRSPVAAKTNGKCGCLCPESSWWADRGGRSRMTSYLAAVLCFRCHRRDRLRAVRGGVGRRRGGPRSTAQREHCSSYRQHS